MKSAAALTALGPAPNGNGAPALRAVLPDEVSHINHASGLDLDGLRAFVAVAETGSVTLAGSRLHLSQPAVTRRVQRLEADLGFELFDRHSKPLAVTAAGRTALAKGRRILQSIDDLLGGVNGQPSGEFRLGVSLTFAGIALAKPIDLVRKAFPRVAFHVTTEWSPSLIEHVRRGSLDMAFVARLEGQQPAQAVSTTVLGVHPMIFVAPRSLRLPKVVEPAALRDTSWILNPPNCGFRQALQATLHEAGFPLRVAVEVHGWDLHLSLVALGVGLGLLPAWIPRRSRLRSRIRPFRVRDRDWRVEFASIHGHMLPTLEPVAVHLDRALARQVRTLL
jgi:DNA-binding transcriptional LysR family regulator